MAPRYVRILAARPGPAATPASPAARPAPAAPVAAAATPPVPPVVNPRQADYDAGYAEALARIEAYRASLAPRRPAASPPSDFNWGRFLGVLAAVAIVVVLGIWLIANLPRLGGAQQANVVEGPVVASAPPRSAPPPKSGMDVDRYFKSDGYIRQPGVKDGPDGNYARFFKEAKTKPHPDCVEIGTYYSKERGEATTRYSCPRSARK